MAASSLSPRRFLSLDGGVTRDGREAEPNAASDLPAMAGHDGPIIARGAGLSYVGASFGAGGVSASMRGFDQVLDFDPATGLVTVQAGITLGALHQWLGPRGYYLPIQPGFSEITVGGCVAANVHGKNPARDGTFVRQVAGLTLFHPDHGLVALSPDHHPDILALTCGGFGLTGIIVSVRLRAERLPGAWVETTMHPVRDTTHAANLLRQHAADSDFTYAWLNFASLGRGFGRGFVAAIRFAGDPAQPGAVDLSFPPGRLTPEARARLPLALLYRPTIWAMNTVYATLARRQIGTRGSLGKALFTFNGNELYHGLFGCPGFHESQVIVPHAALPAFAEAIRDHSARHDAPITLGAGKLFAGAAQGLTFDGDGVCIAVNLRRNRQAGAFLAALDQDVIRLGGRPNLIKDSRLPRAVFEATFPDADRVRRALRDWDPKRRFRSELSDRLGL